MHSCPQWFAFSSLPGDITGVYIVLRLDPENLGFTTMNLIKRVEVASLGDNAWHSSRDRTPMVKLSVPGSRVGQLMISLVWMCRMSDCGNILISTWCRLSQIIKVRMIEWNWGGVVMDSMHSEVWWMEDAGCKGNDGPNWNRRSRKRCAIVQKIIGQAWLCRRNWESCARWNTAGRAGIDAGDGPLVGTRVDEIEDSWRRKNRQWSLRYMNALVTVKSPVEPHPDQHAFRVSIEEPINP